MNLLAKPMALGTLLAALALTMVGCQGEAPHGAIAPGGNGAGPAEVPQPTRVEAPASADPIVDTVENDVQDAVGTAKQEAARNDEVPARGVTPPPGDMKQETLGTTFQTAGYEVPRAVQKAADDLTQGVQQSIEHGVEQTTRHIDGIVTEHADGLTKGVQQTADRIERGVKQHADLIAEKIRHARDQVSEQALREKLRQAKEEVVKKLEGDPKPQGAR